MPALHSDSQVSSLTELNGAHNGAVGAIEHHCAGSLQFNAKIYLAELYRSETVDLNINRSIYENTYQSDPVTFYCLTSHGAKHTGVNLI
jgi:hypothetical protein